MVTEMTISSRLLIILERKGFEEQLAFYYQHRTNEEQARFLESAGLPPSADMRQAISSAVAGMSDFELAARCQLLMMTRKGA